MLSSNLSNLFLFKPSLRALLLATLLMLNTTAACATDTAPRARDLGIPFDGTPGRWNALTDIAGVTAGYHTLQADSASGAAIRTGVAVILPRGKDSVQELVYAAQFSLNGTGGIFLAFSSVNR